jgi:hypothetical protein
VIIATADAADFIDVSRFQLRPWLPFQIHAKRGNQPISSLIENRRAVVSVMGILQQLPASRQQVGLSGENWNQSTLRYDRSGCPQEVPIGMMKMRVVLCLLLLAGSLADAQNTPASTRGNESLLLALESGWNQAQLHHDSKALDGLVADTFISTDNDGTFMTKAQFLEDNKDLSYAPNLMANSDERVFVYGDAAVVAGVYHAKGLNKGKPFDHYGRFTDAWVYLSGKWVCVASHTSALKKKP